MDNIHELYYNKFGIAFRWFLSNDKTSKKIQIVFRDTGLYLSKKQIISFLNQTETVLKTQPLCNDCKYNKNCKSYLLEIPIASVSFAMSYNEITQFIDLLKGTLFQIEMDTILKKHKLI